tara:strand:- start:4747 stop:9276 length:4530 start_codon:yes stop_codon:yes gene_type:complete
MAHLLSMLEREDLLWDEFLHILKEFNNDYVLQNARALAGLRAIDKNSSDEVVRESIRDLGLNLPNEILDISLEKMRAFFYHLPNFEQCLGTEKFSKFISFILDSGFDIIPLWTADYKNFYEQPLGKLLEDGGEWYKTSHVRLLPEWGKLDQAFDTTIDLELLRVLQAKGLAQASDVGADAKDLGEKVLQQVLDYKLVDLFYRFAPLELVLEKLTYVVKMGGDLLWSGHVTYLNKDYLNLTLPKLIRVIFPKPKKVSALKPIALFATAKHEGGLDRQVPARIEVLVGKEYVEVETPSSIIFKDPLQPTPLKIKFRALGRSFEHVLVLMPSSNLASPSSIDFKLKEFIDENSSIPLRVLGKFDSVREIDDPDQVEWFISSANCAIENNVLKVGKVHEDEQCIITAKYWDQDNKLHVVEKEFTIIDSLKERVPVKLEISGEAQVSQGNSTTLVCKLIYSNGDEETVNPLWQCLSPKVNINPDGIVKSDVVHADYTAKINAMVTVEGVTLKANFFIKFIFDRLVVFKTEIVGPDSVLESTDTQYNCVAYWCFIEHVQDYQRGIKSAEEITVQSGSVPAQWTLGNSATDLKISVINGKVSIPLLNHTTSMTLIANINQPHSSPVSTSKFVTIRPKEDFIQHLNLICSPDIYQNNVYPVKVVGVFESGKSIDLAQDSNASIALDIAQSNSSLQDRAKLYILDNKIYFTGGLSGLARLTCVVDYAHTTADSETLVKTYSNDKLVSIIPKVVKAKGLTTTPPSSNLLPDGRWFIEEESRVFLSTRVSYEDNTEEFVNPNWINELIIPDDDFENTPLTLVNLTVSLRQVVEILTGFSPEHAYMVIAKHIYGHQSSELDGNILRFEDKLGNDITLDLTLATDWSILSNLQELQGYPEFKEITTYSDLEVEQPRTLAQCGRVNDDTEVMVKSIYFNQEFESEIVITNRPETNPNKILSSNVRGPREFYANVQSTSFALYVNFDDGGEEYAVSNDWSLRITNKREAIASLGWNMPESDQKLDEMYPDNLLLDIDQDGYVYPKENATIQFYVTAHYDDGFDVFDKTMESTCHRANMNLHSVEVVGPDTILDTEGSGEGVPHIQYVARVHNQDNTVKDVDATWSMRIDPRHSSDLDGIVLDSTTGKLYVTPQIVDQYVIIEVEYVEEFDTHREIVKSQLPLHIIAERAIESVELSGPDSTVDDTDIQITATAIRKNGESENISSLCEWFVLDGSAGTKVSEGRVSLGKFHTDKTVYIGMRLVQGSRTFEESFSFEVKGQSTLNGLSVSGFKNVRDDSVIQFEAVLFRGTNPTQDFTGPDADCDVQECVTSDCAWEIVSGSEFAEVLDGVVRLAPIYDKTQNLVVKATYVEKGVEVSDVFEVTVHSSMPRYGIGAFGISNQELMQFETINSLSRGGSFTLFVESNDNSEVFAYFCHRKDAGIAHIVESKGRRGYGGWSGSNWDETHHNYSTPEELEDIIAAVGQEPTEITVELDNVTTTYLLYRTFRNNFGIGEFAYFYKNQNS